VNLRARRADPLAPDDRRRAIIEAVTPLLIRQGANVTTRQMAEAAGIAEGTIFRVFPDKFALVHEAVRVNMDPEPVRRQLAGIDPTTSIEAQVAEAARLILDYSEKVITLFTAVRSLPSKDAHRSSGPPRYVVDANEAIHHSLTELFERHRDRLRIEPALAAAALRSLIFASAHPSMGFGEQFTVDEIVSVLLTGIVEPAPTGVAN
jgi:AcrR family transcriptional regulator